MEDLSPFTNLFGLDITRPFSLQVSLHQLDAKLIRALSLVECNLDLIPLDFLNGNEQVIQSMKTAGSTLNFSRQPGET